jgi:hypothetical protein
MAKKEKISLLSRIEPARPREKTIPWPIETKGERPSVVLRVLGNFERERAYLETLEYFKGKSGIKPTDGVFINREKSALIARACTDEDGAPIGTVDEVHALPSVERDLLYAEWQALQQDVAPGEWSEEELLRLVEELKKNSPREVLVGSPSSLLIALITTLVDQLQRSTAASSSG